MPKAGYVTEVNVDPQGSAKGSAPTAGPASGREDLTG
jgi:hypothetical protein